MKFKEFLRVYEGDWYAQVDFWYDDEVANYEHIATWRVSHDEVEKFKEAYSDCKVEKIESREFGGIAILMSDKIVQTHCGD